MRTIIQQLPLRMLAGVSLVGLAASADVVAQQADTVRAGDQTTVITPGTGRTYTRENIYRLGKGVYTDTLRRNDFKAQATDVAELDDCDTTFQTFILVRRLSPWRVGLFAGPNFAYCGSWENTFGANKRDKSLYNGVGLNLTGNVDYFFTPATRRLRLGLGTAFGYQNYLTRSAYKDYIYGLATNAGFSSNQVTIRQRSSEDMYLTVGPVLNFTLGRSRKNPDATSFIELALRGGLFRTEAATITAFVPSTLPAPNIGSFVEGGQLIHTVNPSTRIYHPGGLLSLGVFFPVGRNNWNIGLQAQGFYTKLNYLLTSGVGTDGGGLPAASTLYEFQRKHGGFSAGVAVRKGFIQKKLIPKTPTVCPTCEEVPTLNVSFNNQSLKGASLTYLDAETAARTNTTINTSATAPVISWHSNTPKPQNETFTARLYYRPDSVVSASSDQVIAELENTTDTSMTFPANYFSNGQPSPGFYYVTLHNRQQAKCGVCMSDVATTSFSVLRPKMPNADCEYRHKLERLEVYYRTPYTREVANVCYCNGVIASVGDKVTRLRYRGLNQALASGTVEFDTNMVIMNIKDLPGNLAQQLQAEKAKIESGNGIRYKGRRVRPQVQYFRAVFTVTKLPCNGQPEQTVGSFNTTISDNTYSITDMKPLTEEQKAKLLAPPVEKKAPVRRSGRSGRRSDAIFGIE